MAPTYDPNGSSNLDTVGWVSDPNGRGTSSLIISCLLTLGLCVWSALHLNIPAKDASRREYWLRRAKWSLCGVLIPELVILLAWRQRTSAGRLTNEINKVFSDLEQQYTSSKDALNSRIRGAVQRKHPWTNVHSFYAGAGGFVIELEQSQGGFGFEPFLSGPHRLTLTAHGVLLLAECGLLPDFNESEIKDKSKQDSLAKALALLQASWMLLQTLGRVATHIPTSLLEVNTIGHIFCAFIVYLLWWNKPREIHEPTVLKGSWVDSITAYMYMSSRMSGTKIKSHLKPRSWVSPEISKCVYLDFGQALLSSRSSDSAQVIDTVESPTILDLQREPSVVVDGVDSQLSGAFEFRPFRRLDSQKTIRRKMKLGWTPEPNFDNATLRKARHRLAAAAVQSYPAVRARFNKMEFHPSNDASGTEIPTYEAIVEQMVDHSARNWPSDFLLPGLGGELMGMILWFGSMAYGGVHMAAWHQYFPTRIEQYMWRFSSLYIACSGLVWLLMNVLGATSPWAGAYWDRFIALQAVWVEYVIFGATATVCGIIYIFARAFLVVDAFVSLRQLPIQAYSTPQWSEVIPHL
ncbi:uncharacterized protein LY89DRAFT_760740 [Mollisia scopiformis]|uniref:Uncharacterized protein n=1 Tax=Mollisia scopiformis TaxID=149040 RepID=A0A132BC50_MOLSC|nr:uncharacterized protein LY89DRAFT_760740 [Mollisia scopiformis]KUJ09966.1 hypothetical protein LY89DRAFT_760740 [Mollisia scopiformis]